MSGVCLAVSISVCLYLFQILVCADGAPSKLGTQLGIITRPPDSTCSRAYVEAGTHKFKADGVVFYNKDLLPGLFVLTSGLVSYYRICSI